MEAKQEKPDNSAMAFEAIANMLSQIKEGVDYLADRQDELKPDAISP